MGLFDFLGAPEQSNDGIFGAMNTSQLSAGEIWQAGLQDLGRAAGGQPGNALAQLRNLDVQRQQLRSGQYQRQVAARKRAEQERQRELLAQQLDQQYPDKNIGQFMRAGVNIPASMLSTGPEIGSVSPDKYTPASMAKFRASGDYSQLNPIANLGAGGGPGQATAPAAVYGSVPSGAIRTPEGEIQYLPGSKVHTKRLGEWNELATAANTTQSMINDLDAHGSEMWGEDADPMKMKHTLILSYVAKLANMGVLQVGELETIKQGLRDPTAWSNTFTGTDTMKSGFQELKRMLENKMVELQNTYGGTLAPYKSADSTPLDGMTGILDDMVAADAAERGMGGEQAEELLGTDDEPRETRQNYELGEVQPADVSLSAARTITGDDGKRRTIARGSDGRLYEHKGPSGWRVVK